MNKDFCAIAIVIFIVVLLLLVFIKKSQIRTALFAMLVSQFLSWPITLLFVLFGFQKNPVRLFPHATDSNFLFAFIMHPTVFTLYYLYYPGQKRLAKRLLFSSIFSLLLIMIHLITSLYTNLIYYPDHSILFEAFFMFFILYNVSRKYIDWFFRKAFAS